MEGLNRFWRITLDSHTYIDGIMKVCINENVFEELFCEYSAVVKRDSLNVFIENSFSPNCKPTANKTPKFVHFGQVNPRLKLHIYIHVF